MPEIVPTQSVVTAGDTVTICYEHTPPPWSTTIKAVVDHMDGSQVTTTHPVDDTNPCFTIALPQTAAGLLLVDADGLGADDAIVTVERP